MTELFGLPKGTHMSQIKDNPPPPTHTHLSEAAQVRHPPWIEGAPIKNSQEGASGR